MTLESCDFLGLKMLDLTGFSAHDADVRIDGSPVDAGTSFDDEAYYMLSSSVGQSPSSSVWHPSSIY